MAEKRILKKTARQAAVEILGTGSATITVEELATATQGVTNANLILTISDIAYDMGAAGNITRGGNVVFYMNAGHHELNLTDSFGTVLDDQANTDVVVNMGSTAGTVILQFSKGSGYNDPDRQSLQPRDR